LTQRNEVVISELSQNFSTCTFYPWLRCHPFYFFNAHLSSLLLTDKDLNYDDLASGLKAALQNDNSAFDADRLQKYTGNFLGPCTVCIEIN